MCVDGETGVPNTGLLHYMPKALLEDLYNRCTTLHSNICDSNMFVATTHYLFVPSTISLLGFRFQFDFRGRWEIEKEEGGQRYQSRQQIATSIGERSISKHGTLLAERISKGYKNANVSGCLGDAVLAMPILLWFMLACFQCNEKMRKWPQ